MIIMSLIKLSIILFRTLYQKARAIELCWTSCMQTQVIWYTDTIFDLKQWKSKIFQTKNKKAEGWLPIRTIDYVKYITA